MANPFFAGPNAVGQEPWQRRGENEARIRAVERYGPVAVTSSTRPANPVVGALIYETDTNVLLVWTGSLWQELTSAYSSTNVTPGWTPGTAYSNTGPSITLPAGSWVIEGEGWFDWSEGSPQRKSAQIWNSTDGTEVNSCDCNSGAANGQMPFHLMGPVSLAASKTFVLRAKVSAVTGAQLMHVQRLLARPASAIR